MCRVMAGVTLVAPTSSLTQPTAVPVGDVKVNDQGERVSIL